MDDHPPTATVARGENPRERDLSGPPHAPAPPRGLLRSLGPAIIIACVVLGPGSIFTSSKVGAQHGYGMIWVLAAASILMIGMVALSARVAVALGGSVCDELTGRVGRWYAALIGIVMFLVIASFQSSNNIAVVAAMEPLLGDRASGALLPIVLLIGLNVFIIFMLYGFRRLYKPIEWMMLLLVGMMLIGFIGNAFFARPSPVGVLKGFMPRAPGTETGWMPLFGLVATTFSVAGAFYHAYLVREKGWTTRHLKQGIIDAVAGISILGGISIVIMATSAAVLVGRAEELSSAADIARQLEPLFGPAAVWLFSLGLFAAAFSSFLVNAMAGGTLLSDGLGLGSSMDQRGPKACTVLALLVGMIVAIVTTATDASRVGLIIFAQALTILGNPVLAFTLLWLATRPDINRRVRIPLWMKLLALVACLVTLVLAWRTGENVYGLLFTDA